MSALVAYGPNLNLRGTREPEVYGAMMLEEVDAACRHVATALAFEVNCLQQNSEGGIVAELHVARGAYDAIVLDPDAYTHDAYAIRDAIAAIDSPTIEVHRSNTMARESFRSTSVVAGVCRGSIAGCGANSCALALRSLAPDGA